MLPMATGLKTILGFPPRAPSTRPSGARFRYSPSLGTHRLPTVKNGGSVPHILAILPDSYITTVLTNTPTTIPILPHLFRRIFFRLSASSSICIQLKARATPRGPFFWRANTIAAAAPPSPNNTPHIRCVKTRHEMGFYGFKMRGTGRAVRI